MRLRLFVFRLFPRRGFGGTLPFLELEAIYLDHVRARRLQPSTFFRRSAKATLLHMMPDIATIRATRVQFYSEGGASVTLTLKEAAL